MAQPPGVVTALAGDVEVIHADGSVEALHTGDFVYTDDVIKTSADGPLVTIQTGEDTTETLVVA